MEGEINRCAQGGSDRDSQCQLIQRGSERYTHRDAYRDCGPGS